MSTRRRHESLIPLSREHHYALMLCLHINRGLAAHREESGWLQTKARQAALFVETDLATHFRAEEQILFPSIQRISDAGSVIERLLAEHRELERLGQQLREVGSATAAGILKEFAALLEDHIRKEERLLFPIFERELPEPIAAKVGRCIVALIGSALHPNHPELLEP
ncbi:MAG TPA: hemerythrin domain-containing protein [Blastocatellia bacterium]|nr:hemerythrin domain-containing protein [Blastocatellia bacterium]